MRSFTQLSHAPKFASMKQQRWRSIEIEGADADAKNGLYVPLHGVRTFASAKKNWRFFSPKLGRRKKWFSNDFEALSTRRQILRQSGTVVVAQLVAQALPTPEVCSSNPFIRKIHIEQCLLSIVLKTPKIKRKEAGNDPVNFFSMTWFFALKIF